MDPRTAYSALILGRLSRDYGTSWERIRHWILWENFETPISEYGLTRADAEHLRKALRARAQIRPTYTAGIRTFESVFELLLFEEGNLFFGGWQARKGNAFRGHRDAGWMLTPTLARAPAEAERHIEDTLAMARLLLADESPVKDLTAIKILGVLQHYGFITSLLDFTTDVRIAAAFACRRYEPERDRGMGCVIRAHGVDFEEFATVEGTPLGRQVRFKVDEVERIRNQKGIFFADFKVGFLETFTSVERSYFKHGPETERYGETVGLKEDVLFPPGDRILRYVEASRGSFRDGASVTSLPAPRDAVFREIEQLLRAGYRIGVSPLDVDDYAKLARNWVQWDALSQRAQREISIFARWFGKLHLSEGLDLPSSCLTLRRLKHAVEMIAQFDERAEDATDIFDRLKMHGRQAIIPALLEMFEEARTKVSGEE